MIFSKLIGILNEVNEEIDTLVIKGILNITISLIVGLFVYHIL
jgi:hypothetical protein